MSTRKLTEQQVREIRCFERLRAHYDGLAKVYQRKNIANKYGVSYSVVTAIVDGHAYANVTDMPCEVKDESKANI
jgi:transposase